MRTCLYAATRRSQRSLTIERCTINRRVVVQRWPAVPTAPKRIARTARSDPGVFRDDDRVVAAKLQDGAAESCRNGLDDPAADGVEPVNDTSGRRPSPSMRSPITDPGPTSRLNTPSASWSAATGATRCCTATAHSGTGSAGFQMTGSPHTAASAAFQDQTATGKLKAVMTPTGPSGCHCSIIR